MWIRTLPVYSKLADPEQVPPEQALAPDVERYGGNGRLVDEGRAFEVEYFVRSVECGASQTVGAAAMAVLLQEAATEHAFLLWGRPAGSYPVDPTMRASDLIFVLTRLRVAMSENPPRWGQRIAIRTWFCSEGKAGARREWEVRDAETGELLASATSVWILLNMTKRRLARVPEETRLHNALRVDDRGAIGRGAGARKVPDAADGGRTTEPRTVDVALCDNDANGHVNNARYVQWAVDAIPPAAAAGSLALLEVEFISEAGLGDRLHIISTEDAVTDGGCTEDEAADFLGTPTDGQVRHVCVLTQADGGKEVARVATEWRMH